MPKPTHFPLSHSFCTTYLQNKLHQPIAYNQSWITSMNLLSVVKSRSRVTCILRHLIHNLMVQHLQMPDWLDIYPYLPAVEYLDHWLFPIDVFRTHTIFYMTNTKVGGRKLSLDKSNTLIFLVRARVHTRYLAPEMHAGCLKLLESIVCSSTCNEWLKNTKHWTCNCNVELRTELLYSPTLPTFNVRACTASSQLMLWSMHLLMSSYSTKHYGALATFPGRT